jgi:hypothetical protein
VSTFNQGGAYSVVNTLTGTFYLQNAHYFNPITFADLGTSLPGGSVPMGTQNSGSVAITGGTIDGTTIGATTPAAATFTTVTATSISGSATPSGAAGGDLGGTYPNPTVAKITNPLSQYGGTPLVANGVGSIVSTVNLVNQNANVSSATLYAVPASGAGTYRVSCYAVETTADGASSTLPNIGIGWTDSDSSVSLLASTVTSTNTANAPGAFAQGIQTVYAKASTNITYQTSGYASGTAGAMKYAVHIKLEYLG